MTRMCSKFAKIIIEKNIEQHMHGGRTDLACCDSQQCFASTLYNCESFQFHGLLNIKQLAFIVKNIAMCVN